MVTVDQVTAEARKIDPAVAGRLILTAVASLLYVLGWIPARTVRYLWVVLVWSFAAVKLGWQDGIKSPARR